MSASITFFFENQLDPKLRRVNRRINVASMAIRWRRKGVIRTRKAPGAPMTHFLRSLLFLFSLVLNAGRWEQAERASPFGHSTVTLKSNFHRDGNHRTSIRIRRYPERFARSRPPVAPTATSRRKPAIIIMVNLGHHLPSNRSSTLTFFLPPRSLYTSTFDVLV